jgi:hypothetical protein
MHYKRITGYTYPVICFHSISFPNEWGEEGMLLEVRHGQEYYFSFHSISFPNEWGVREKTMYMDNYFCPQFPFN